MAQPWADPMLLGQLEWHLDQRYAFRTQDRYKGFLGWFRAKLHRELVEEYEEEAGKEHEWHPSIFASDPQTYEELYQKFVKQHEEDNFSLRLMRLIESKGLDHVTVYKKARIDRKLFSRIRSNHGYLPSKKTILALALAMELTLEETEDLLKDAGYSLSTYILFDVILEFFISQKIYDLDTINAVLYKYQQQIF